MRHEFHRLFEEEGQEWKARLTVDLDDISEHEEYVQNGFKQFPGPKTYLFMRDGKIYLVWQAYDFITQLRNKARPEIGLKV